MSEFRETTTTAVPTITKLEGKVTVVTGRIGDTLCRDRRCCKPTRASKWPKPSAKMSAPSSNAASPTRTKSDRVQQNVRVLHIILDLDFAQLDSLFAINVRGAAAGAMAELPTRGSIVCTTKWTDYVMSKHAVVGLVRAACRQLGEHEIRVNSVSPYAVATSMTCWKYEMEAAEVEQAFEQFSPLKGIVLKVKHLAEAVLYLESDESAFVSGHDQVINGAFLCSDRLDHF